MSVSVLPQPRQEINQPPIDIGLTKGQLRALWAEILEQDATDFSEEDTFFEAGGNSVTALELSTAAQAQGIFLTVEQIFVHVTLEEMAREALASRAKNVEVVTAPTPLQPFELWIRSAIEEQRRALAEACRVTQDQIHNAYPCTPMQESLVSLSEGKENLSLRQLVYELDNDLDIVRFQNAWNNTAQANPILRTRICQLQGQLRFTQVVINEDIAWTRYEKDVSEFLENDAHAPMRLGDPFFRFSLVPHGDRQCFVWTVHHALCDAASLLNILDEVSMRFQNEPIIQRPHFEHFIEATTNIDPAKEREFWRSAFAGLDVTPFPPVPQSPDFHANPETTIETTISLPQSAPFGVTKALLLRAIWGILQSHQTGTENVVFGAINNGRHTSSLSGISQMTGPTINLLPAVMQVTPTQSVGAFLGSIRSQVAEFMPFEHTGTSKIRTYLAGTDSTVTEFQNVFVVHSAEFGDAAAPSLQKLRARYINDLGKTEQHAYPLVVSVTLLTETSATLKIQYDEQIISTLQARNLTHQFQAVLSNLERATADTPIGSIASLSEHDLSQIREWNKNTVPVNETCIHTLFEEQALRSPNAEAICSIKQSLTYAEVDGISSSLALRLAEAGVGPETPVAVCFEKSIWTAVAMQAVFKAGGFYVPIDPTHPRGRIVEIMETVQIRFSITSPQTAVVLDDLCDNIFEMNDLWKSTTVVSLPENFKKRVKPSNTAYLLFTSGSTGKPKGVLIPHSAMATSIVNHGPAFGASPDWRTLQFAAHTFDISMTEFCTTLAFGGCICVPSDEERMNDLAGAITKLRANVALVVPTVANLLSPSQVPTLKTLVLGGEPVTKETISKWADHVNLTAGYGPSETAVYSSGNLNASSDAHPADIGRSIGGTMWLVNAQDHNRLTAIGCVGEIVISGPIVGNGYFKDPETTNKSFVLAPEWLREIFPAEEGKKIYKTGDLGRYNPDGTFRIVGRSDTQVKLRGFRIELGEIENRIKESGPVVTALATLPSKGPCAKRIVAVICLSRSDLGNHGVRSDEIQLAEIQPDVLNQIKTRISLTLPEYMIPSVWVVLEKFPLLASGKIDRRLIKTWVEQMDLKLYEELVGELDTDGPDEVVAGTTAEALRAIWADVLKVQPQQVGLKTSFFSLGGDSIAAIHVVSQAKKVGLSLTTTRIMSQKTLGNVANLIEQSNAVSSAEAEEISGLNGADGIQAYSKVLEARLAEQPYAKMEDSYPFTPIQREILRQREINPAIFVLSWKMEFSSSSGPVSLDGLARAWNLVVQKHHVLRSIFVTDPEGTLPPLQVTLLNAQPSIAISSSEPGEHEPTTDELLPALDDCFLPHRAHFSRRGNEYFGHIELDHLVIDGWSFRLIKEDLLAAYASDESQLAPPTYTFKSVVKAHQPGRISADTDHWTAILRDQQASRLSFPVTLPESVQPPSPAKTVIYLPELHIGALAAFSTKFNITPASIFDAAWAQTLSHYTGSRNVTYEYVVSNRDLDVDGIFDIVGPVMNLLAFHLHDVSTVHSAQDLATVADQIQEQRLQDSGRTTSNLREIVQDDLKKELPFNTALNFQRRPLGVEIGDLKVYDHLRRSSDPWHFDVLVRILHIMDDNIVRPSIEFDARIFDERRMKDVADTFWSKIKIALDVGKSDSQA